MRKTRIALALVEAALGLMIAAAGIVGWGLIVAANAEGERVNVAGTQLRQLRQAADVYIRQERAALLAVLPVDGEPIEIPLGQLPNESSPPPNSLQALGLLPSYWQNTDSYGHRYHLLVRRVEGTRIEALIITTGGQQKQDRSLARIAGIAGALGGYVPTQASPEVPANTVLGTANTWRQAASTWSVGGVSPQPGALAVYIPADWLDRPDDRLRRFDVGIPEANRMRTDLRMEGNDVSNIGTLEMRYIDTQRLRINQIVTPYSPCETDGDVALTGDGDLALCNGGEWIPQVTIVQASGSPPPPPQNCSASMVNWSQGAAVCSGDAPAANHGQSVTVTSTNGLGTGTATFQCVNGTWSQTSGSCSGIAFCPTQTVSWSGEASGCSGSITTVAHGGTQTVTNAVSGRLGSATFLCDNGTWQLQAGATCMAGCPAQPVGWSGAASGCFGLIAGGSQGQLTTVTNTVPGRTGTATFQCTTSGSWQYVSGSCATSFANCSSGQWVSWGSGCQGWYGGGLEHGQSTTVSNSASGYTGWATVTCNNGSVSASGSCTGTASFANCPAGTVSWGSGCSASVGFLSHGQTTTVSNSASGYTGWATVTCNNGSVSASGSCTGTASFANCPAGTVSWGSGCSASVGSLSHGQSTSVTNTASGFTGSATVTCNNGSRSVSGSCTTTTASCSSQTVSWGSGCSAFVSSGSHGTIVSVIYGGGGFITPRTTIPVVAPGVVNDSTYNDCLARQRSGIAIIDNPVWSLPQRRGEATFSCNNGTWQFAGGWCGSAIIYRCSQVYAGHSTNINLHHGCGGPQPPNLCSSMNNHNWGHWPVPACSGSRFAVLEGTFNGYVGYVCYTGP